MIGLIIALLAAVFTAKLAKRKEKRKNDELLRKEEEDSSEGSSVLHSLSINATKTRNKNQPNLFKQEANQYSAFRRESGSIATIFTSSRQDTLTESEAEEDEKPYFDVVTNNYLQRTLTNETMVNPSEDDGESVLIDVDWKKGKSQLSPTYTRDSNFVIPKFKNNVKIGDKSPSGADKRNTIIGTKLKSFLKRKTVKQYEEDKKLKTERRKERKKARSAKKESGKEELKFIYSPQDITRISVENSKKIWNLLNGSDSS
ncbi:uncharacterized protein KQ657_000872 [Scheffersomyces spartinae]|uniref:Uncharacterized protein n=1 Tax=Scheffersomyces spartinae TaxID=45513 RepID=A0A9P8AI38_9ASCO|nr:uncharacterized protein KQ657_000872 [Scheffersomyces spartinae]KAG7193453.1 hypothetical protein KQ657_000872 [Scheffersomyces spartinae]